jgi:glycosyltransferase involved in cell wall biosynthesis
LDRPRILFISPQPFFTSRGSPFRVRSTVSSLSQLGYSVDLLVLPLGDDVEIPNVEILRAYRVPMLKSIPIGPSWPKVAWDLSIAAKALALVRRRRYAVLHGIEEGGVIAAALGKLKRIPYVFDMHSHMSDQLAHSGFLRVSMLLRLFRRMETACMRGSSGIITVGDELTEKARHLANGVPATSLQDLPLDSATDFDPADVRRLGAEFETAGRKVLLYTGNFEPYQGIDLLLLSFASLLKSLSNGSPLRSLRPLLILAGGGSGSLRLVRRYQQMALELGIASSLRFAGERPAREMGAFMALADVLLSPRVSGNNPPLKIYSYMTTDKPIVATRISSHTQVLDDRSAFLAAAEPEEFSRAMLRALDTAPDAETDRRARIAQANHLSETRFSRDEFNRRLADLYSSMGRRVVNA